MNAIEKKFYNAFFDYVNESPSASVHSDSWKMKIAEYSIEKIDVDEYGDRITFIMQVLFPNLPEDINKNNIAVIIDSQSQKGPYTLDFEITTEEIGDSVCLAVEIDGHDFHEKTKEQAWRDKKRDRDLATYNCTILRFTGSEIYTNPTKSVKEVLDILISILYERHYTFSSWYSEEREKFYKSIDEVR